MNAQSHEPLNRQHTEHDTEAAPENGQAGDTRGSRRRRATIAALVAVPVLVVAGFAGYLALSGTPLIDEWTCSDGDAPVLLDGGGSACAPEGATLEPGETWDPLGNRPLSCDDRWGWTQVRATGSTDVECLREGEEPPTGYEVVG